MSNMGTMQIFAKKMIKKAIKPAIKYSLKAAKYFDTDQIEDLVYQYYYQEEDAIMIISNIKSGQTEKVLLSQNDGLLDDLALIALTKGKSIFEEYAELCNIEPGKLAILINFKDNAPIAYWVEMGGTFRERL